MEYTHEQKEAIFEQNKTETFISQHYIFHFPSGSLAEKEILSIAQTQECAFAKVCALLKVQYPERIHYYLADSPLEIGRVFWEEGTPCNGCALCGSNKIYAVYSEAVKCLGAHEDTHLISFLINFPESDFTVEGLSMCVDGLWWGVPNEVWAAYYHQKHPELTVKSLLDNDIFAEYGCVITYPIAGAFTKFLMDTYGVEDYLEFYKYTGTDYEDIFPALFRRSLQEIEEAFWKQMDTVPFDAAALEEMLRAEGF